MTFVSLLLPVRNERGSIQAVLEAVLQQDYPAQWMEVLVADGMSTDGTRELVQEIQSRDRRVKLIDNPGRIVPTGLNAALRSAQGEVILRVDGHTRIAPDYVRQCLQALARSGADNASGRMDARGEGWFGEAVAAATSSPFGVGGARFHYSPREEWVDTVYMGAWPREVFRRVGLFDEELVRDQDDEFNYRLRASGGRVLLSPLIRSTYTNRSTPGALWRQYFQYGYYKVRVLQKHPRQMGIRQFIPPVFVLALLLSLLAGFWIRWSFYLLAGIALMYLLANLGASLLTARRRGWRHLPALPLCFATLHLAYGSGFLAGLWHFRRRWGDRSGKVPRLEQAGAEEAGRAANQVEPDGTSRQL